MFACRTVRPGRAARHVPPRTLRAAAGLAGASAPVEDAHPLTRDLAAALEAVRELVDLVESDQAPGVPAWEARVESEVLAARDGPEALEASAAQVVLAGPEGLAASAVLVAPDAPEGSGLISLRSGFSKDNQSPVPAVEGSPPKTKTQRSQA